MLLIPNESFDSAEKEPLQPTLCVIQTHVTRPRPPTHMYSHKKGLESCLMTLDVDAARQWTHRLVLSGRGPPFCPLARHWFGSDTAMAAEISSEATEPRAGRQPRAAWKQRKWKWKRWWKDLGVCWRWRNKRESWIEMFFHFGLKKNEKNDKKERGEQMGCMVGHPIFSFPLGRTWGISGTWGKPANPEKAVKLK